MKTINFSNILNKENKFISTSIKDTFNIAKSLINSFPKGLIIALHGDLGAGKTCFVQGIAQSLEINKMITSPTFTILNEYQGILPLYHFDLYRLKNEEELFELGFEEYVASNSVIAIEWPEVAENILPNSTIHVYIQINEVNNTRDITIVKK